MKIYSVILIGAMTLGCREHNQENIQVRNDTTPARIREIPFTTLGDTGYTYYAMRYVEADLGLEQLVYGYDSMQIRIMLTFSLSRVAQLIILSNHDNRWKAEVLDLESKAVSDTTSRFYVTKRRDVMPQSGWPLFMKVLIDKGLTELPDYSTLPDYYYNTDEKTILIEYATAEFYKVISYPSRPGKSNLTAQENQVENIIQYLEKELNFKRYKRPQNN
jgi:hypothetical protein